MYLIASREKHQILGYNICCSFRSQVVRNIYKHMHIHLI